MIKITYITQKDNSKARAPYWQVGYQDPKNNFQFKPVLINHYGNYEADCIANALNEAVGVHQNLNALPGNDKHFLDVVYSDPNDSMDFQKSLDTLSGWLSATDRLEETLKGSIIQKISEIQALLLNVLKNASAVDVKKDSQGNWRLFSIKKDR